MQSYFSFMDGDALGGILATFFVLLILFILLVSFGLFIFWIAMLVDASKRTVWPSNDLKIIVICVLALSLFMQLWWVAALVYYFAIKRPLDAGQDLHFFSRAPSAPPAQEAEVTATKPKSKPRKKPAQKKSNK